MVIVKWYLLYLILTPFYIIKNLDLWEQTLRSGVSEFLQSLLYLSKRGSLAKITFKQTRERIFDLVCFFFSKLESKQNVNKFFLWQVLSRMAFIAYYSSLKM